MSRYRLAQKSGIAQSSISTLLNRKSVPTIQTLEKICDGFGITLTFPPLNQDDYLKVMQGIAEEEGIKLSQDELEKKALQWVLWQNSRSGRTARQFINNLLIEEKRKES